MKVKVPVLLAMFLFTFSILCFPMKDSTNTVTNIKQAGISAAMLQQKILLNDKETDQIKSILTEFAGSNNFSEINSQNTLLKVESVLDQRQKAKFDIIKTEWWNNFMKGMNKKVQK